MMGNAADALNKKRQIEIEKAEDTEKELTKLVHAQEDLQKSSKIISDWFSQIGRSGTTELPDIAGWINALNTPFKQIQDDLEFIDWILTGRNAAHFEEATGQEITNEHLDSFWEWEKAIYKAMGIFEEGKDTADMYAEAMGAINDAMLTDPQKFIDWAVTLDEQGLKEAAEKIGVTFEEFVGGMTNFHAEVEAQNNAAFDAWRKGLSLSAELAELTGNEEWALNVQYQERQIILQGLRDTYGEHADALIDVQKKIWAATEAQKEASAEFDAWRQGLKLSAELADLIGDSEWKKNVQYQERQIILKGLSDTYGENADQLIFWQQSIWDVSDAMEKARKLTEKFSGTLSLYGKLASLTNNTELAAAVLNAQRKIEIENIDESNRALQWRVWALEDEQTALSTYHTAAQSYLTGLNKELDDLRVKRDEARVALDQAIAKEKELMNARLAAADSLRKTIDSLMISDHAPVQSMEYYDDRYARLLRNAQTADTPEGINAAVNELNSFMSQYLDFSAAYGGDYLSKFNTVIDDLEGLEKEFKTDAQIQSTYLAGIEAQLGIVDSSILSIGEALTAWEIAETALNNSWMNDEIANLESILDTDKSLLELQTAFNESKTAYDQAKLEADNANADTAHEDLKGFQAQVLEYDTAQLAATRDITTAVMRVNANTTSIAAALDAKRQAELAFQNWIKTAGAADYYEWVEGYRPKGYATGGISHGPASGYLAELHGSEAIVPLPNGKSIPVEMSAGEMLNELKLLREEIKSMNTSGNSFGNPNLAVSVKIGERELHDITTDVIRTDPEAQRQVRRVAHAH